MMYSKIKKILFLISIIFLNTFCSSEEHTIPDVSFSVEVPPTTLVQMGVNSSIFYPGTAGIKGVIIFKESEGSYFAYERLCPNYPNDECALGIDNSITATCPCCKSTFSLFFGTPMEGVAERPLKKYQTTIIGGRLYIMN